ncbi:MAG: hypothetical protein M3404_07370 [Actinomycetota bacterium]|nr:hypothetical protein [Actinomycetota bacterium]
MQVLAARTLGASAYGSFALLLSILVLVTALHTAWVGDSLTVLDRFEPDVRGVVIASQAVFMVAGPVVAVTAALLSDLTDTAGAILFATLVAMWLLEEAGRRVLMARSEFWKLVLNDAIYVIFALVSLALLRMTTDRMTLNILLASMAIGAGSSVVAAGLQLPAEELRWARPKMRGIREVAGFAPWRSAQAGVRPLAFLCLRVLVSTLGSRAALGRIEAARLLLAPAVIFSSGLGSFLLSMYSDEERNRGGRVFSLTWATATLVGATALYAGAVLLFLEPFSRALTAGSIQVDRVAVLGWALVAIGFSAGLPAANAAVARRRSREVFQIRAFDSAVGLTLVVVIVASTSPSSAPFGLAFGMFVGAAMLWTTASKPALAAQQTVPSTRWM